MGTTPPKQPRSTSTSSGLRRSTTRSAALFAVLLLAGLLTWALPALAGPQRRLHQAPPSTTAPASTGTPDATVGSAGRWSAPFSVQAPVSADVIAPLVAVSPADGVAVGTGQSDEDDPAAARAAVLISGAGDVFDTTLAPAGVQQTLAAGYLGNRLVVLTGASGQNESCCSTAATQSVDGGAIQASQPLVSGLEGDSTGALVPVRGGLLAAVDNQAGITVARSDASGVFSGTEQLTGADPTPPLMAAGSLRDGGALVAWTAPASAAQTVTGTTTAPGSSTAAAGYDQPRNRLIDYATSGPAGSPGAARLAVTVPAGRQIDALAVIPHGAGATLAWTESWYVANTYESRVFWADVSSAGAGQARALSPAASAAVGVSAAGSSGGREVLSWQACDISAGTCVAQAALRPSGGAWSRVQALGSVDPTSFPVATQSRRGESVVGWISGGHVESAVAAPAGTGFAETRISAVNDASDLALSFGSGRRAAAVWVQGTVDEKLVGARFTP